MVRFFFIFILMVQGWGPLASAEDRCSVSAVSKVKLKSFAEVLNAASGNCASMAELEPECRDWFNANPATLRFARCKGNDLISRESTVESTCGRIIGEKWKSSWDRLIGTVPAGASNVVNGLTAAASDIRANSEFLRLCEADASLACKRRLAFQANLKSLSDDDLRQTLATDLLRKLQTMQSAARRDSRLQTILDENSGQSENDRLRHRVPTPSSNAGAPAMAAYLAVANTKMTELGVKYRCYNGVAYAEMACHALAEVTDPVTIGATIAGVQGARWVLKSLSLADLAGAEVVAFSTRTHLTSASELGSDAVGAGVRKTAGSVEGKAVDMTRKQVPTQEFGNEPAKYRELAMTEDDVQKMKKATASSIVSPERLPGSLFGIYKEARLRGLTQAQRDEVEKIVGDVSKLNGVADSGLYDPSMKMIRISLEKYGVQDILYYRTLAHEMEHAVQFAGTSRKRAILNAMFQQAFAPQQMLKAHYLQEVGATKAEFDFWRAIPQEAMEKIAGEMRRKGEDAAADQALNQWHLAKTDDYGAFKEKSVYPSYAEVQKAYPGPPLRTRVLQQAFFIGVGAGGVVGLDRLCAAVIGAEDGRCSVWH